MKKVLILVAGVVAIVAFFLPWQAGDHTTPFDLVRGLERVHDGVDKVRELGIAVRLVQLAMLVMLIPGIALVVLGVRALRGQFESGEIWFVALAGGFALYLSRLFDHPGAGAFTYLAAGLIVLGVVSTELFQAARRRRTR